MTDFTPVARWVFLADDKRLFVTHIEEAGFEANLGIQRLRVRIEQQDEALAVADMDRAIHAADAGSAPQVASREQAVGVPPAPVEPAPDDGAVRGRNCLHVAAEENVYPMVAVGKSLHEMEMGGMA